MEDRLAPKGRDRRLSDRIISEFTLLFAVKEPFHVRMHFGEKDIDAVAQDLGEGGLALISNGVIPINTRLGLKFKIFNDMAFTEEGRHRSFELTGDVRYSVLTKETDYRLGIQFVKISEADRRFINHYIDSNRLDPTQRA